MFSLFYSIWTNPDTKIHQMINYLLETTENNSRTWAAHIRYLSTKYNLPDPLECLERDPPPKPEYKEYIQTKITAYFETILRSKASTSSSLRYLNVSLTGLRGKRHPALSNIVTTHDVKKARIHLKMLAGDFLTHETKSRRSGGSPHCRSCEGPLHRNEDLLHILTECSGYLGIRERMLPEFFEVCRTSKSEVNFEEISKNNQTLCQFILDPTSFNLQKRVHMNDPAKLRLFQLSRDYCYTINTERTIKMRQNKS